ncbi:MAG: carboxypeptidase regulatory-like domain-containing protein [Actinobacteria bacterium]|nr:carboxypeptidase regulatory-like domain-containing protein [Actinomycetota bacterium]
MPLAALLLLVLVSCGARNVAGDGTAGIQGEVLIGPTCPAERLDSPCPPAPFAARITVSKDGDVVTTVETPPDGTFRIPLAPGTYSLRATPLQENPIARTRPLPAVTVREGAFTSVTIMFDSGIR